MVEQKAVSANELREIRLRERSATVGPWKVQTHAFGPFTTEAAITTKWVNDQTKYPEPVVSVSMTKERASLWVKPDDADFIASAREDIPRLLASLDAFGHRFIYDAMLNAYNQLDSNDPNKDILRHSMDICWQIIKEKSVRT